MNIYSSNTYGWQNTSGTSDQPVSLC